MTTVHYHTGQFPPDHLLDWPKLIPLIGPASAAVARYDGMLAAVPNSSVLLSPLTTQEAVLSSRIEGTQATMGEVLEFEAGQEPHSPARRDDIHEVLNYRTAVRLAEDALKSQQLSQQVIRNAHSALLAGVRGEGKSPGEYRHIPNWIGPPGCTIEEATFVPIMAEKLQDAMSAWEHYIHRNDTPDRLVQLAILHAESLHPFLDGNGRLGRMLVPLFLWQCNLIRAPMFYISAYFEARRDMYYEGLLDVSRNDNWTGWCRFFLEAVRVQAEDNLTKAQNIIDLYDSMKGRVMDLTHSRYSIRALDWIFERPIFRIADFVTGTSIPERTARRLLDLLCKGNVLKVVAPNRGRRTAVLAFPDLLNLAEGSKVF